MDNTFHDNVVDGVRESGCQEAVTSRTNRMDAAEKLKRIDIGGKRIEKIVSKASVLGFIKQDTINQILFSFIKDPDFHRIRSRMRRLASPQSPYTEVPS